MAHHEPFKALGPIDWTTILSQEDDGSLSSFLATTFANAQTVANSIPASTPATGGNKNQTGRPRSATDSAVGPTPAAPTGGAAAAALRADWKEVKLGGGARDNPHAIAVYRLAARDGRGTWFARRSLHHGIGFTRWRTGLQSEFEETLKRARPGEPGTGNIRGIGAEKRVETRELDGDGSLKVYQLSARFPGPTTPRDFVTLLLTSDDSQDDGHKRRRPRQFMVVSNPCSHPDCPERQGFIRGQYESVEIVREVLVEKPLRRVRSSIDVSRDPFSGASRDGSGNLLVKEAMIQSARQTASDTGQSGDQTKTITFAAKPVGQSKSDIGPEDEDEVETAIEWLMVTRSDPGGSVPRFLVDKGTPMGIVNDAGRLIDWLSKERPETTRNEVSVGIDAEKIGGPPPPESNEETMATSSGEVAAAGDASNVGPSGFYGMIANALEAAGSLTVSKLLNPSSSTHVLGEDGEDDSEDEDDISSSASFASAEEGDQPPAADVASSSLSTRSAVSGESHNLPASAARHEKALRKLEERQRKAEEKAARELERAQAKRREDDQRDAQAAERLREKHEKELARQEDKYRREREKLEERRRAEEKKTEERRRKDAEREVRADLQLTLERARAERDVALKQIEILKDQVGALQAQNTRLVREAGGHG